MQLSIDALEITGFKCFTGKPSVINLGALGHGLHFVRGRNRDEPALGSNGAGKSSLWDALLWCLYGRTPDGLRNPDVKPWFSNQASRVALNLRCDDDAHVLVRSTDPNKLMLDYKFVDQSAVDELIGLSMPAFKHTVLLGQGQPLFFDLKPQQKMELFGSVLDLDRWDARSKRAGSMADGFEAQADKVTLQMTSLNAQLDEQARAIARHDQLAKAWEDDRSKRYEQAQAMVKKLTKQLDGLQRERDDADLMLDGALMEQRPLQKQLRVLQSELDAMRHSIDNLKQNNCPTCGRPFKRAASTVKLKDLLRTQKMKAATFETLQRAEKEFQTKADNAQFILNKVLPILGAVSADIKMHERMLREYEAQDNPHAAEARALKRERAKVTAELRDASEQNAKLLRRMERYRYWVSGFKRVRLYVVENVLQELELATNTMLDDVGLEGWEVQYSIEKETKSGSLQHGLNVTIFNPNLDKAVRWEAWSGGEAQRLRVIGALALGEVLLNHAGVRPRIEILDEPTQHLSDEGVEDLCAFLADRARGLGKAIFYTDHKTIESARFKSVLTIVKTKEGARAYNAL